MLSSREDLLMDLPVIGQARPERADAARNRALILDAARRLVAEHGIENVSMESIARAAGVGKGTVFRRFGDRSALAYALLDERGRDLQDQFIRGAPPLGPGAPPRERLIAFGRATIDKLEEVGEVILAAERSAKERLLSSPYSSDRAHVVGLLRQADPTIDVEWAADALLAPLGAGVYLYQRRVRELEPERIKAAYEDLVTRVLPRHSGG